MTFKLELEKLQQINVDYSVRTEDASEDIGTLHTDIEALELLYTQQVQANNDLAYDTFDELEAAKKELKRKEATVGALTTVKIDNSPLEAQANIALDAISTEIKAVESKRTIAVGEFNAIVDDLVLKAREIKGIQEESNSTYKQINLVEKAYPGIAEKRLDFFMKTAYGYEAIYLSSRYRHDQRLIVGHKLEHAIAEALPRPTTW